MPRPALNCAALAVAAALALATALRDLADSSTTLDRVSRSLDETEHVAAEVMRGYRSATRKQWEAREHFVAAAGNFREAGESYAEAAQAARWTRWAVLAAFAYDAVAQGACGRDVSRAQYRTRLKAEGANLEGKDIGHIIPRAHGGLDRPWNYLPMDASLNRSLGVNTYGWMATQHPLLLVQALAGHAVGFLFC